MRVLILLVIAASLLIVTCGCKKRSKSVLIYQTSTSSAGTVSTPVLPPVAEPEPEPIAKPDTCDTAMQCNMDEENELGKALTDEERAQLWDAMSDEDKARYGNAENID